MDHNGVLTIETEQPAGHVEITLEVTSGKNATLTLRHWLPGQGPPTPPHTVDPPIHLSNLRLDATRTVLTCTYSLFIQVTCALSALAVQPRTVSVTAFGQTTPYPIDDAQYFAVESFFAGSGL